MEIMLNKCRHDVPQALRSHYDGCFSKTVDCVSANMLLSFQSLLLRWNCEEGVWCVAAAG